MTDQQQHLITPPQDKVYKWWEEACKRPPSSFYEKLDHVAARAAAWGWQQRAASVPGELQQAQDEELEACCKCLIDWDWDEGWSDKLYAARRPKPKSLKEQALETLHSMQIAPVVINGINVNADVINKYEIIRRALESLPS